MAGLFDVLFEIYRAIIERRFRFLLGLAETNHQTGFIARHPHAPATATGGSFDQHRKAHLAGEHQRFFFVGQQTVRAGHDGHLGLLRQLLGLVLVAHGFHGFFGRADELEATFADDVGELAVLAQEAEAWVDGIGLCNLRRSDDAVDLQVAFAGGAGADADGLIGQREVRRAAVGLAVHHGRLDAHIPARTDDTQGNLATVGNQNALKHGTSGMGYRVWGNGSVATNMGKYGMGAG